MVNVKVSLFTVALTLISGACAQCANNAVELVMNNSAICVASKPGTAVKFWPSSLHATGTWNQAATISDIDGASEQYLCGQYQGSPGFGPAHVDCDGSGHITGAVPPNAAHYHCYDETHVIGEGVGGIAAILSCCQPD